MTRPRVLLAITKSELGGAQRYVEQLVRLLPGHGFEPEVACGGNGWLVDRASETGAKVIQIQSLSLARTFQGISELWALRELERVVREGKYDIVHGNSTRAGFLARLAARRGHVPVVIFSAHGFFFEEPMTGWRRAAYIVAERMAARWSDAIIMSSEIGRSGALRMRLCPAEKLIKIPYGLDEVERHRLCQNPYQPDRRSVTPGTVSTPLVGTVAGLYPAKGLDYLVGAMADIRKEIPTARLVIVGDGPERKRLEALIQATGLHESVSLLGKVADAWGVLMGVDVFVVPSVKEGLPYAILEAMAAGLPIVATRVGGIPEVLADRRSALLVPPADSRALGQAICDLLRDPSLAAALAGEARRTFQRERLTAEAMVEATAALYRRLLAAKRSSRNDGQG
jgi:glycosyltransferase involved in cell wall biosynthesis